jgi:hypothetical protein
MRGRVRGQGDCIEARSVCCRYLDRKLMRWAQRMYKTLRRHKRRSEERLFKMKKAYPRPFAHWQYQGGGWIAGRIPDVLTEA